MKLTISRLLLLLLLTFASLALAGEVRLDYSSLDDYARPDDFTIRVEYRGDFSDGSSAETWEELRVALDEGRTPIRREPVLWETLADYHQYEKVGQWRLLYDVANYGEWDDPRVVRETPPKVSILMYHDIRETSNYSTVITPRQFESQVRYLAENGYTFITIGQLLDAIYAGGGDLPDRCVALTFDDGWSGIYKYAYPILKQYGGTATFYLYTNYINVGGRSLTWDQHRELIAAGFEIGSHTCSHANLPDRKAWKGRGPKPPEGHGSYTTRLMHELLDSKLIIEENLGIRVRSLALPYGAYDDYVLKSALLAGYEGIVTIVRGNTEVTAQTNELELKRWNMVPSLTLDTFEDWLNR